MTIERELLKRVISGTDDGVDFFIGYRLYKDIETFLAQPETEPSDAEIITAYQMLVRRKLGLQEKNAVLQLGEPDFNAQITVKKVCKHKNNGRCQLHNLQCQYPECEE